MVTGRCGKEIHFWEGEGVTKVGWEEVDRAWSVSAQSQNAYLVLGDLSLDLGEMLHSWSWVPRTGPE